MDIHTFYINTAKHLISQKCASADRDALGERTCLYAGPDGNACAIGVHLPRELAAELDRLSIGDWGAVVRASQREDHPYRKTCLAATSALDGIPLKTAVCVQVIHDNPIRDSRTTEDKREMIRALREYALRDGLTLTAEELEDILITL